jgi:nitrogen fixation protein NifU and related proteins
MSDLYREVILEAAAEPANQGHLDHPDATQTELNASCGDQVSVELQFGKNNTGEKIIQDLKWTGKGCAISQASMSFVSEAVIGQPVTTIQNWELPNVLELLGFEDISYGREKCAMLGLKAIQHACQTQA